MSHAATPVHTARRFLTVTAQCECHHHAIAIRWWRCIGNRFRGRTKGRQCSMVIVFFVRFGAGVYVPDAQLLDRRQNAPYGFRQSKQQFPTLVARHTSHASLAAETGLGGLVDFALCLDGRGLVLGGQDRNAHAPPPLSTLMRSRPRQETLLTCTIEV